jgi:hypothetical protein
MQTRTKWHVDQLTSPAGHPVFVLRFDGDIAATSKEEFQGCYQSLPKESSNLILLDFSKVNYITKVFSVAGITKYAELFHTQAEAIAAF